MPKHFWFNILLLFFPGTLLAQTVIEPEWLTIKDGLSQGFAHCMVQDQDGFLWFGTKNGLNRYDGENFRVFTHDVTDPYSISHDFIYSLFDYGNFLLVGTRGGGLNIFHKKTKRFYKISLKNNSEGNQDNSVIETILKDSLGQIWVAESSKLAFFRLRFPLDFQSHFPEDEDMLTAIEVLEIITPDPSTTGELVNVGNNLLVTTFTPTQIIKIDIQTGKTKPFEYQPPLTSFGGLQSFSKDGLLMFADYAIGIFKAGEWNIINTDFKIHDLAYLEKEQKFFVTTDYVYRIFNVEVLEKPGLKKKDAAYIIPENESGGHGYLIDRSGILWVGTGGYGIMKFSPRLFNIKTYSKGTSVNTPPFGTSEGEFFADHTFPNENLYVPGKSPKLNKMDFKDEATYRILEDEKGAIWIVFHEDPFFNIYKIERTGELIKMQRFPAPNYGYHSIN